MLFVVFQKIPLNLRTNIIVQDNYCIGLARKNVLIEMKDIVGIVLLFYLCQA